MDLALSFGVIGRPRFLIMRISVVATILKRNSFQCCFVVSHQLECSLILRPTPLESE
jgi:hypothetical protein